MSAKKSKESDEPGKPQDIEGNEEETIVTDSEILSKLIDYIPEFGEWYKDYKEKERKFFIHKE